MAEPQTRTDVLLGGKLQLTQLAQGHRAGTDAILLAAAVAPTQGLIIDVGAGVGSAGLSLALRLPGQQVALLENDPQVAALARINIAQNQLGDRVGLFEADLLSGSARRAAGLGPEAADMVLTNPPFFDAQSARTSPHAAKASAHMIGPGGLEAWVKACLSLLKPGGDFIMIHRADALAEILACCQTRLGGLQLRPIHPRAGEPAIRLLVKGRKGSRAPLTLLPGLVLHGASGNGFTPIAEALHQGEAALDWA